MFKKKKIPDIELMHSYPDFPNDVIEVFGDLIKQFHLKQKIEGICSVDLENNFCKLNFNMDRYDLQVLISKKGDSETFAIYQAAMSTCPDKNTLGKLPSHRYGDRKSIQQQLLYYARIVKLHLSESLTGNLDWYNKLKSI